MSKTVRPFISVSNFGSATWNTEGQWRRRRVKTRYNKGFRFSYIGRNGLHAFCRLQVSEALSAPFALDLVHR